QRQSQLNNIVGHFSNYWMAVPAGTASVTIRGTNWIGGPWWVRDVSVWSLASPAPTSRGSTQGPQGQPQAKSAAAPRKADNVFLAAWHGGATAALGGGRAL